jgi:hypothetical protein
MAPSRPKPLIDGAVSICNWVPDQAVANDRVVPSVQIGHGDANVLDISHPQTITANVHYVVSAHNVNVEVHS